jgi:Cu2+-exporting ATPase
MGSPSQTRAKLACPHCGSAVPGGAASHPYCCAGCAAVAALLRDEGLDHYYDLGRGKLFPVGAAPAPRGHAWLEALREAAEAAAAPDALCDLQLDVQGVHCAACVWLMNETFRRAGGAAITVNPALGKARLAYLPGRFDVARWVTAVERFGYQFGPGRKERSRGAGSLTSLTWRLGICAALAMNVMLFSISFYVGLSPRDAELYRLFGRLSVGLSTAVVAIGGWPFFVAAARGLRARVLHLDLPIALGILLVYATSMTAVLRGRGGELTYFDTLNVFATLMLAGRFVQQALLERNRNFLLADDGAEGIHVRRVGGGGLEIVPAPRIRRGDRLLIAPGELVPVDALLESNAASVSTDWINGEATARAPKRGERILAGSFNAGREAIDAVAETDFAESTLVPLLRQVAPPARSSGPAASGAPFWDAIARRWVLGVLALAAIGLLAWLPRDARRALDVTVALLVVTCPCGIGIALPLAYELVQARLRRSGFFARRRDLMDRLVRVRALAFDKTGTLTLGGLELAEPAAVRLLTPEVRDVAYNLASRSSHPVSSCIAGALAAAGARFDAGGTAVEVSGSGLEGGPGSAAGWRLGRAGWAAPGADLEPNTPCLARGGAPVATFATREVLRPGAVGELGKLRDQGFALWLISGDNPRRAARLAQTVGIEEGHVRAARAPADKAADVRAIGDDVLYLGDGVNDALAFGAALCAGTVAVDRPVLPGRSDFFLVGSSLAPLALALGEARRLRRVAREVVAASIGYNTLAVATSLAGLMTPLRAAIAMPISSLLLLVFTAARLGEGGRAARPVGVTLEAAA